MEKTKQKAAAPAEKSVESKSGKATARPPKKKKGMVLGLYKDRMYIHPDFFDEHERPPGWKPAPPPAWVTDAA